MATLAVICWIMGQQSKLIKHSTSSVI